MKVALVNPPWRRAGRYGVRAGSRWPHFEPPGSRYMPYPFMLGYAGALLGREGFEVALFDGCASRETDEAFLRRVVAFAPELLVQENATASIDVDLDWARRLKAETGAFLLMTGHHVEQMSGALGQHPYLDALAGGEWERTVLETAVRLRAGEELTGVAGLVHRGPDGSGIEEPRRANIEDLDGLPFPLREGFLDMHRYHDNPGDLPDPCLQLQASRGCPFRCSFCVWPQVVYHDHRYRVRSPKSIVDELEHELRHPTAGYRSYYFDDDTFNIGNARLQALADEIILRGLEHVPWGAMCRADTSSEATLTKLRRAGLCAVKYGVESGNQELLDRSGKRLDLGKLRQTMAITHALGIKTHLAFCFGLVGETRATLQQTLDLALELDPHTVQFSIATPFPGTAFHDYAVAHGLLLTDEPSAYDGLSRCVVRTEALAAEELEDFLALAYDTWHRHAAGRRGIWTRVRQRPLHALGVALRNPRRAGQEAMGALTRAFGRARSGAASIRRGSRGRA